MSTTEPKKNIFNTICNCVIIGGLCLMLYDVYAWQKKTQAIYQQDMKIIKALAESLKIYSNDEAYINAVSDKIVERSEIKLEGYSLGQTFSK